jgi:uracil-DNA glycosylase
MSANLWSSIPAEWQVGLTSCRSEIEAIDQELVQCEQSGVLVVPPRDQIFSSLSMSPREVSVVVIGQDPYPNMDHAIGLAFAVPVGTSPLPGSLRNIFKEVESDCGVVSSTDCTLRNWTDQGVLLLNTSLTTEEGLRARHASWPWQPIVLSLIRHVVTVNPNVVALLWGNAAKDFSSMFNSACVVQSAHPSPLSASRGFLGSKPFTRTNDILAANGRSTIIW